MANDENIPAMLLNGFGTKTEQHRIDIDAMNEALLITLIDTPESAFVWNELKQVYVVRVAGRDIELRKSSYEGLKYMRDLQKYYR